MKAPTFLSSLILLLATLTPLAAAPKIATVDASKVKAAYQLALDDEAKLKAAKDKIDHDPRKLTLDKVAEGYQDAILALEKVKQGDLEFASLQKKAMEAEGNYKDLANQWNLWRNQQIKELTAIYVVASRQRFDAIAQVSQELGNQLGFDWVLETSGATNSNISPLLFVKNSTDISEKVIAELNKRTQLSGDNPEQSVPETGQ